jgi:hypothetical protein
MEKTPPADSPKFRLSIFFWIGLVLLVVGSGPLFITIQLADWGLTNDPHPNPVMFGVLFFFTFPLGLGLIFGGLVFSFVRRPAARVIVAIIMIILGLLAVVRFILS